MKCTIFKSLSKFLFSSLLFLSRCPFFAAIISILWVSRRAPTDCFCDTCDSNLNPLATTRRTQFHRAARRKGVDIVIDCSTNFAIAIYEQNTLFSDSIILNCRTRTNEYQHSDERWITDSEKGKKSVKAIKRNLNESEEVKRIKSSECRKMGKKRERKNKEWGTVRIKNPLYSVILPINGGSDMYSCISKWQWHEESTIICDRIWTRLTYFTFRAANSHAVHAH